MLLTFNSLRFDSNIDIICYAQFLKDLPIGASSRSH